MVGPRSISLADASVVLESLDRVVELGEIGGASGLATYSRRLSTATWRDEDQSRTAPPKLPIAASSDRPRSVKPSRTISTVANATTMSATRRVVEKLRNFTAPTLHDEPFRARRGYPEPAP